jgi:4-amino-4-deoxychorismate lyase
MRTLINGTVADQVDVGDRGLMYGDGLFETIAVENGRIGLWERHLERLVAGCRRLGLAPPDPHLLRDEAKRVTGDDGRAVVKIVVTRGRGARGYRPDDSAEPTRIVQALPWPGLPTTAAIEGVRVRWCALRLARQPQLAGLKHLNRLEQVLARAEWRDEYAEGLMRDTEGLVIEGTMSNLFLVHQGVLTTPDLSESGVAGVVRAEVLARAPALGIPVAVRPVTPAMVEAAEELFLTNSLIGLWPIRQLETRDYVVGKITQALQQALQEELPGGGA